MRSNIPNKDLFLGKTIPGRSDIILQEWKATGNDGILFRGHSAQLKRDFACKIIPKSNLQQGPNGEELWRVEVHKADALRNTCVVKFSDIQTWAEDNVDCVVLVAEYVNGVDLKKFLEKNNSKITIPFIIEWLSVMLDLFNEMSIAGVAHGDLHVGNIMVEDKSSYTLRGSQFEFRVTDFGVGEATSTGRFKDDYQQLADILNQLLGAVDYQALAPKDKYAFHILRDHYVGKHLVEHDVTRDSIARNPRDLYSKLIAIESDYEKNINSDLKLLTPFDFLSCEQIGDAPTLLRALYSERFLGLREIEGRNNVVVTGPRGCGKSTVFKSLSLDQKIQVEEGEPEKVNYVGIYYRCDDLYFSFPRYVSSSRAEAIDIPIHFLVATLLSKTLHTVEVWARKYFQEEFLRNELAAGERIWNALKLKPPPIPGNYTFRILASELERERKRATEWQRFSNDLKRPIGQCFGVESLLECCSLIVTAFSFLKERPIYFFIDDYSSPKVTQYLQMNLNRVLMQRSNACFFKLSTESPVSFIKSDIDGKTYVESREFIFHNLGTLYLHSEKTAKLQFLEDVFNRRLSRTLGSFPASELEELIGSNARHNNNADAREIKGGKQITFWGKEVLCHLCSGDIHYVISLVGDMVKLAGGVETLVAITDDFKIHPKHQNRAIREAAGGFLRNLRSVPKCGEQLVNIVQAFGNVANSYIKYRESKNEGNITPHQATRIEPYEHFNLSETAQKLYDELLRYSVFLEDFRGKSRRGKVVPRLFLRRFLIPHFNLTFSTRDSIELDPVVFESFLLNPNTFEDKFRLRNAESGPGVLELGLELHSEDCADEPQGESK